MTDAISLRWLRQYNIVPDTEPLQWNCYQFPCDVCGQPVYCQGFGKVTLHFTHVACLAKKGSPMSSELPRYRCHKIVQAAKIVGLMFRDPSPTPTGSPSADLQLEVNGRWIVKIVPREWVERHKPELGGYYVVYEDGYASFSPAKAFEEGYTRLYEQSANEPHVMSPTNSQGGWPAGGAKLPDYRSGLDDFLSKEK